MTSSLKLYVLLYILICFSMSFASKGKFAKIHKKDIVFPPILQKPPKGLPTGHLRPLGWQKWSDGRILETLEMPTAHKLYIKYIKNNKPVMIREAFKEQHLPILEKWDSDEFLTKTYGSLNVETKINNVNRRQTTKVVKFKTFLEEYKHEEWHLGTTIPDPMLHEIPLPDCLKCGSFHKRLQEVELWMSYGDLPSLLHNHEDHMLHCVLFGLKNFILIDQKYRKNFAFEENYKNAGAGSSHLDMDRINLYKNKEIANTPWNHASLRDGDCILIPAGFLHQVVAYKRSLSFSILFAPTMDFDSSDCRGKMDMENQTVSTMSDAKLVWTFRKRNRVLAQADMEPHVLKHILLLLLRTKDKLYHEQFEHFYDDAVGEFTGKTPASSAFSLLVSNVNRNYLTRDEINNLSTSRLLHLSRIINEARVQREKLIRDEL